MTEEIEVAICTAVRNGSPWLSSWYQSLIAQTFKGSMEISVFNDGSTDGTGTKLKELLNSPEVRDKYFRVTIEGDDNQDCRGVGFAKNRAVQNSTAKYICFYDVDDIMAEDRIELQLDAAQRLSYTTLIGSGFTRLPVDSTVRFTRWANNLSPQQLYHQAYLSHGPSLVAPTWFASKKLYNVVGPFNESEKNFPEDLEWFYRLLRCGGHLHRVDKPLIQYRYHTDCATFGVTEETIWKLRVKELERQIISSWSQFTIWNAGKQGKKLFRSLTEESRRKLVGFCDVDEKKIRHGIYEPYDMGVVSASIPITHYSNAARPFVICVKLDLTDGRLELILKNSELVEGVDYYHFN